MFPSSSLLFVSAPCLSKRETTSSKPSKVALCNGVWQTQTADLQTTDLQTCRLADSQTRRFEELHFLWQGFGLIIVFILCLLLANRKVRLRQTTAGCKHNSARFDRWLEILAVEDLTSEERWPKLQREQRRRRRVGSSSGRLYKA